ncbi:TonB-dependent receptor [Massilia sp. SR12]
MEGFDLKKKPQACLLACSSLLLPAVVEASAQTLSVEGTAVAPNNTSFSIVEVKGGSEGTRAQSDAAAKTVVNNAELIRFGASNVTEALKHVPGLLVVKGRIQLQGMTSAYTQVLIDGEPPRGVNFNDLPISIIERVEIYRQGNAQFSSQAIGGTINIVLKKVLSTAQQQVKAGVYNEYKPVSTIEWLASDKRDNLSYSVSVLAKVDTATSSIPYDTTTQVDDESGQPLQVYSTSTNRTVNEKSLRLNPRLQYRAASGTSYTLTASVGASTNHLWREGKYSFHAGHPLPVAGVRGNSDVINTFANITLRSLINLDTLGKLDANVGIHEKTSEKRSDVHYSDTTKASLFRRESTLDANTRGFSGSLKLTIPSTKEHDLVAGLSGSRSRSHSSRYQQQVDSMTTVTVPESQLTDTTIDKVAAFVQDEWKLNSTVALYFGVRGEVVRLKSSDTLLEPVDHTSNMLSPIVQSLWKLDRENVDRIRFGLSRSYQPPADHFLAVQKVQPTNNTFYAPDNLGNPHLRPERAWSLDWAFEHSGKDELNYNLRLKSRRVQDVIREQLIYSNGIWWTQHVNADRAMSTNIDFDMQFPLSRFVGQSKGVDLNFEVSKNWSKVTTLPNPNNILVPITLTVKFGADYTGMASRLSFGASAVYAQSHIQQISPSNTLYENNPLQLDLYGTWKFSKSTLARISVMNALRRNYIYRSEEQYGGMTAVTNFQTPQYRRISFAFEHKL